MAKHGTEDQTILDILLAAQQGGLVGTDPEALATLFQGPTLQDAETMGTNAMGSFFPGFRSNNITQLATGPSQGDRLRGFLVAMETARRNREAQDAQRQAILDVLKSTGGGS